jgi:hypothetical protein
MASDHRFAISDDEGVVACSRGGLSVERLFLSE